MKIIKEFKDFAVKGNVLDLAIGVIIGGAFGKIVTSLVNDILMPPLGALLGGVDFSEKVLVLKSATPITSEIVIRWGAFINNIIDFLIVAVVIFIVIKQINRFKTEEKKEAKAKGPSETELLTEIRDLLKK